MFWIIIGIIGGVGFIASALTLFIIYQYGKSAEQAYKDGWDFPNW